MLDQFYIVSGLRPNLSKCEIASIGSLKDTKVALCGLKTLDLTKESTKFQYQFQCQYQFQQYVHYIIVTKLSFSFHYYVHYAVIKVKHYFSY